MPRTPRVSARRQIRGHRFTPPEPTPRFHPKVRWVDYVAFMARMRTITLHIPFHIVFSCFVIFLVLTVLFGLVRLRRLLSADWHDAL